MKKISVALVKNFNGTLVERGTSVGVCRVLGQVREAFLNKCVERLSSLCFREVAIKLHDCHDEKHVARTGHHAIVKLKDANRVPIRY